MQSRRVKKGFTLIELLVVVAIIAVLIAILLPALGQAREMAKQAACTSNLHQTGLATLTYSNDHQGMMWIAGFWGTPVGVWGDALEKYKYLPTVYGPNSVTRCPSHPDDPLPSPYVPADYTYARYGCMIDLVPAYLKVTLTSAVYFYCLRMSAVEEPSRFSFYHDSVGFDAGKIVTYHRQAWCIRWNVNAAEGLFHLRHGNRGNSWFIDGHAGSNDANGFVGLAKVAYPDITSVWVAQKDYTMVPVYVKP